MGAMEEAIHAGPHGLQVVELCPAVNLCNYDIGHSNGSRLDLGNNSQISKAKVYHLFKQEKFVSIYSPLSVVLKPVHAVLSK